MTDDGPSSFVTVARKLQLPNEVHQTYENNGVKKLYDWQLECLFCTGVLDGKNLVYCAPTSGGKTLISELVLLRNVLILRKRVVFVLPYVSLVLEKTKYFKKLLKSYNNTKSISEKIIVKAYYGDVTGKKGFKGHIIICTIEKANSVINSIIINSCTNTIGCLIIDEMHILGDQFNGYLLEILISKFRLLEIKSRNSLEHCKIQLIGMSATVGNVKFLANWFGGSLFITGFRPVPLVEYIIADNIIYDIHGTELSVLNLVYSANKDNVDKNKELSLDSSSIQLMSLVYEGLYLRGQQCLIFCPTKFSCQTTANMLSSELQVVIDKSEDNMNKSITYSSCKLNNMKLVEARNHYIDKIKKSNELVDIHLLKSIANGIAYHHSGLTSDIKAIIEDAFYKGIICALCATTTLAAGVNLPAGRVIIRSLTIGRDNLLVTQYKQMCGRAGRAGQSIYGESFLLVKKNELLKAIELVNNTLPNVVSQVHPSKDDGRAILKALLEMISLQLIKTVHDVKIYIEQTLMYQESLSINQADDLVKLIYESLLFLIDAQAININYNHTEIFLDLLMSDHFQDKILTCSRFGKAITVSGLNPDEAIIMYKDLLQAETGFNLETSLHLTYIITPLDHKNQPDFKALLSWYDKAICRKNSPDAVFIKTMSLEQSYGLLNKWSYDTPPGNTVFSLIYLLFFHNFSISGSC
jgi:DNA polymerase theta